VAPHYRRPHLSLVWTGHGRAVPKIVPRRGSVVHREVVAKVPSGFGGARQQVKRLRRWPNDLAPGRMPLFHGTTIRPARTNKEPNMKALSARQPQAEAIMRGVKPIEHRSYLTKVRGRIYIYASRNRFVAENEAQMLKMYGMTDVNIEDLPRGVLVGTVELWDCTGSGGNYQWHLRNPERARELLKPTKAPRPLFEPF
jgi:hypothetical protein